VAGCVATWQGRILLCQRSIEPYRGLWTIPGGYAEIGETLQEAAARETLEEAHGQVSGLELLALYNLPMFSEVYALFSAQLAGPEVFPGEGLACGIG
jgi:ADP-ribose pyrophosphatase YjhB (NUDIX family)